MFQGPLFSLRHNGKAVGIVPEGIGFYFVEFFFSFLSVHSFFGESVNPAGRVREL